MAYRTFYVERLAYAEQITLLGEKYYEHLSDHLNSILIDAFLPLVDLTFLNSLILECTWASTHEYYCLVDKNINTYWTPEF